MASQYDQLTDTVRINVLKSLRLIRTVDLPAIVAAFERAEYAALHGGLVQIRETLATLDELLLSASDAAKLLSEQANAMEK
jgi:hypothetical protein